MITQGSHRIIKITCEKDMELIQDVKIMIYNKDRVLKNYSKEEIQINKNIVSVELTQADTMSFDSGTAYMEMKYMDEDGLVEVSKVKKIYIDARKDDRELEGNPIGNPIEDNFEIDEAGNIIIYKNASGGGASNEKLEAVVKEYFEAHKEELKGEPGEKGAPGEKGEPGKRESREKTAILRKKIKIILTARPEKRVLRARKENREKKESPGKRVILEKMAIHLSEELITGLRRILMK